MKNKSPFLGVGATDFTGASSSDEETLLDGTTPATSSISVLEPLPITLNKLKTSVFPNNYVQGQSSSRCSTSSHNQTDVTQEIDKKVRAILTEALFYSNDPREYHPFYLEVDKVISSCQSRGYIGQDEGHIRAIWKEFDNLARKMKEKGTGDLVMPTELSPYAVYIKSGKANGRRKAMQMNRRFQELKSAGKRIFEKWKFKNVSEGITIRDDLEARLEFFQECKTVTSPEDVVKMNSIWKEFLSGFENPEDASSFESEPVKMVKTETEVVTDAHEVPMEIKEEPFPSAFSDHEDVMEDFPSADSPEWEAKESSTTSKVNSVRSSQRQRKPSKRKLEEAPAKHLTRHTKGKRIKESSEIKVIDVPPEYDVRVVVEDIAKSSEWGAKVKRMLGRLKLSSRTRSRKTTPPKETFSTSINVGTKCRSMRIRSSRTNQKYTEFAVVANQNRNLTTDACGEIDEKPKKARKPKESRNVRRYRKRKFKADWGRKCLSLAKICRRRRLHEQERSRRSEKAAMTLEYVLAGLCDLRTLKNRKEWFWTPIKILNSSPSSSLNCPFCETRTRPFRNSRSRQFHIGTAHPRENRNMNWVKDLMKKMEKLKKNQTAGVPSETKQKRASRLSGKQKWPSPNSKVSTSTFDCPTVTVEGPKKKKKKKRETKSSAKETTKTRTRSRPPRKKSSFDCPYCDLICSTLIKRLKHIRSVHPSKVIEYQRQKLKEKREKDARRMREKKQKFLETGEGPQWLKDRIANRKYQVTKKICNDPAEKTTKTKSRIRPPSEGSSFDCLYCDFKCGTIIGRMNHVRSIHPAEVVDYKEQMLKKKRERAAMRKREQRKQIRETGEGPEWLKDRIINGRLKPRRICDDCGASVTDLPQHKASVHNADRDKMNTCPLCSVTNTNGVELWHHFTSTHLNYDLMALSKLKGEFMGFKYTDSANVASDNEDNGQDSRVITTGPGDYQCDLCAQKFATSATLKRHLNTVHAEEKQVWDCPHCFKTFTLKCSRDAHVKQIHEGQDHPCDICGKTNQSKGKLWRHMMDAHGISEPPEGLNIKKCLYCDEMLLKGMLFHVREKHPDMEHSYLEQVRIEKNEKRRLLGVRKKSYEKDNERRRKLRVQWKETGVTSNKSLMRVPPKNCPHCGIECTKKNMKDGWADHMRNEHGIEVKSRKFVCPVEGCDKRFYEGKKLREHSMTHFTLFDKLEEKKHVEKAKFVEVNFIRPYLCLICERNGEEDDVKGMGSKGEVLVHFAMRHCDVYRKLKGPLEPDLGEAWDQLKELNLDVMEGGGASAGETKPVLVLEFHCPHCSTALLTKSALIDHVMVLHPEECWECPYPECTQIIISPNEMHLHFAEAHGEALERRWFEEGESDTSPAKRNKKE